MVARDALIVIPARGGSKGIPRKNLRLLNGRPLIGYALSAAQGVGRAQVVVSSDDEEILAYARSQGVEVIERPVELAADDVPLDPVVRHALAVAESRFGREFQWVVTVQPTSPLLRGPTIADAIRQAENQGLDSCLTVVDSRHLCWTGPTDDPTPLYTQRVNRQWLPPLWRETGAVVVSRGDCLRRSGRRIGGRIGLLELPKAESVDIDDYDDWVVAEHRLSAPRVAFRVDGNRDIGLGHVHRCLALASRLTWPTPDFYVGPGSELASQLLQSYHYPVFSVHSDEKFVEVARGKAYDLVINDILDTTKEYVAALRADDRVVINFEDLGPGGREANLTFNALYEYSTAAENQRFGWQYACLRDEFVLGGTRVFRERAQTLLILFGGTDPADLTARAVQAAELALGGLGAKLQVVLGMGYQRESEIAALLEQVESSFASVSLAVRVRQMSALMREADLALTSNGRTVYELAASGVPMIIVSQNRRETGHTFGRISGGAVDLGLEAGVSAGQLAKEIRRLWESPSLRRQMSECLSNYDLSAGVARVIGEIEREWKQALIRRTPRPGPGI